MDDPVLRLLSLAEPIERFLRRRERLRPDEAEEFHSYLRLKLVERGQAIRDGFRGRSTFETYLAVVVQRLFLDYRAETTGKWRPSAVARKLGPIAVRLEERIARNGDSVARAIEELRERHGVPLTVAELESLAAQLPPRSPRPRQVEDDAALESVPATPDEDPIAVREDEGSASKLESALEKVLAELPAEDGAVVRLHFLEGLPLSSVATLLRTPAKPLYRRVDRVLAALRTRLESEGIDPKLVRTLVGRPEFAIGWTGKAPGAGNRETGPSREGEGQW